MFSHIIDSTQSIWRKANADIINGLKSWRISYLLGKSEVSSRYRRSKLGQFWITLSLLINIITLSFVWSYLWKIEISDFMPYYAFSFVIWTYILNIITESTSVFDNNKSFISGSNIPISTYVFASICKHNIILLHNIVLLPIIFIIFGIKINVFAVIQFILAFVLTTVIAMATSSVIAVISLRFKDVQSIVLSLMNIAFYVTPVIWKLEFLSEKVQKLMLLNPFALFLLLMRNPIFGVETNIYLWGIALLEVIIMLAIAYFVFSKFRHKIAYWI